MISDLYFLVFDVLLVFFSCSCFCILVLTLSVRRSRLQRRRRDVCRSCTAIHPSAAAADLQDSGLPMTSRWSRSRAPRPVTAPLALESGTRIDAI